MSGSARAVLLVSLVSSCSILAATHAAADWLNPGWGYRRLITARADSISGTGMLEHFTMLLSLDEAYQASIFYRAKSDGSDIVITGADGITQLERELVGYDAVSGKAEIWIRTAALAKSANNFFIYYGNPDTTVTSTPGAAWSQAYRVVYHFSDDPGAGVLTDSGPQQVHITLDPTRGWTSDDVALGQIHQAWMFNGTSHHVASANISAQDSSYVISAWVLNTSQSVDFVCQAHPDFWHISSQTNSTSPLPDYAGPTVRIGFFPRPIPINTGYHHFAWSFDAIEDTLIFYFDGQPQPVYSTTPLNLPVFYTGRQINPDKLWPVGVLGSIYFNNEDQMTGGGDEFRIREGVLSPNWILTEYRNQRDPQGFFEFGEEETGGYVPVRLLFLGAERAGARAVVRWTVAGAGDGLAGFHVHRENAAGGRERLTPELLLGSESYTFTDQAPPMGSAAYWVAEHSRAGDLTWHGPVSLQPAPLAEPWMLRLAVSPNPFRAGTTVRFLLEAEDQVALTLYDLGGREVARLVSTRLPAGEHEIAWDGLTAGGVRAIPGIYVARLEVGGSQVTSGKLVLLP